jgi:predicted choloylglycine hydrolase
MYKPRFKGRHYDIGYRFGSLIYKRGRRIEQFFNLDDEKREFGIKCIRKCEKVFPELLDEIRGLAAGTRNSFENFASFIFGIYCFEFDNWCTCFAFKDDKRIVLGRNSDFAVSIEDQYESAFYRPENGYSFIGNSTAMVQMEDGVNEHGLAAGLTFIFSRHIKPGLNAGILLRFILEKCKTVKEALDALSHLPISSSQALVMADKTGDIAVAECNPEKLVVRRPKKGENFIVAANQFVSAEMLQYGKGGFNFGAAERYKTAYNALKSAKGYSVELAQDILSGRYGFMCQYQRSLGLDTVWSCVYDLRSNENFRAEGNPSRVKYMQDERLSF